MTTQIKAAGCEHTTAAEDRAFTYHFNFIPSLLKAVVVILALRGLLSYRTADWLIRSGGLRHA